MKLAKELKQSTKDNQIKRLKKHLLWKNKDGVRSRRSNRERDIDRSSAGNVKRIEIGLVFRGMEESGFD